MINLQNNWINPFDVIKMRKILLISIFILLMLIFVCGCLSSSKQYDNSKFSFSYPVTFKVNETNEVVSIKSTDIRKGSVYTRNLTDTSSGTVENFLKSNWGNFNWNGSQQLNGNTYYGGFIKDEKLDYNVGVFLKGNTLYIIEIDGNSEATRGFNQMRDTFKIK